MGPSNSLDISASGLTLDRLRMNVIANNIANAQTTRAPGGGPYRREIVQAAPIPFGQSLFGFMTPSSATVSGGGVQAVAVVQDNAPFQEVYDPTNPAAVNGYVQMPNVNVSVELADMASAVQAYDANSTAFDASKQLDVAAISIGKA